MNVRRRVSGLLVLAAACGTPAEPDAPAGRELVPTVGTDRAAVIEVALRAALLEKRLPDLGLMADPARPVLSTDNLDPAEVPTLPGVELRLLSPEDIQRKADREGDFLYLHFERIEVDGDRAEVRLSNTWAVGKGSEVAYLSGGGFRMLLERREGRWVGTIVTAWIS